MATEKSGGTQTWYRVSRYFDLGEIEAREIDRSTSKFVMYTAQGFRGKEERREGRITEHYVWLPTEAEAVEYARDLLTRKRDTLRSQLEKAETALAAFNAAHPSA